jgi:folate-binding protein YgfZ
MSMIFHRLPEHAMTRPTPDPEYPILLDDITLICITGPDRKSFLQGQLTQNVDDLSPGHSVRTGWASAKGRLLFVTQLIDWKNTIWAPVPAELAESIARRLRMFVLRADVEVTLSQYVVLGAGSEDSLPQQLADKGIPTAADKSCIVRVAGDPGRSLIITECGFATTFAGQSAVARNSWTLADIRAGIPQVVAATSETFVPQMVNLDLLDGISFTKGCYVGQEIVARTQNLGRIKRRMCRLGCESPLSIQPGDQLFGAAGPIGRVVTAASDGDATELLAVVPLTEWSQPIYADETQAGLLRWKKLPYAIPEIV